VHGVEALCLSGRELELPHAQHVETFVEEPLQDRACLALLDCVGLDDAKSSLGGHGGFFPPPLLAQLTELAAFALLLPEH
jgi:hypothetical protein